MFLFSKEVLTFLEYLHCENVVPQKKVLRVVHTLQKWSSFNCTVPQYPKLLPPEVKMVEFSINVLNFPQHIPFPKGSLS